MDTEEWGGGVRQSAVACAVGANSGRPAYLGAAEFAELPKSGLIDPRTIRYSQDTIGANFEPPFGSVEDFSKGLSSGTIDSLSIRPIRIVERDGMIFSLDNRRLNAFEQAAKDVPYLKLDTIPKRELFKFTTKNDGTSIIVR
jgi:hypothetical protein